MELKELWQFMQIDMEADKFEASMRQSENRKKLIKQRNFLMDQQSNMKKLESDVLAMQDRLEAIKDESIRLEKALSAAVKSIDDDPPKDAEAAEESIASIEKISNTISRYEQELQKMRKDAEQMDNQQKNLRMRAARTKQEYDQLKSIYDEEFKRDSAKLAKMRANTESESKKINPDLLARYKQIKQHSTPPMARLINDQCSGCFMALPSATLLELKQGEKLVECDNCGRILYQE